MLDDIEFDKCGHLLNIYRPSGAKVQNIKYCRSMTCLVGVVMVPFVPWLTSATLCYTSCECQVVTAKQNKLLCSSHQ